MQPKKEVTITRILNAPRELVFKAWTEPTQLAQWWGPDGFTNPVCEVDLRPGGELRICMHAPQMGFPNHWMKGVFQEIIAPERIVFTNNAFIDDSGNAMLEGLTTVTFAEENGKTKLTVHAAIIKAAPGMEMALAGMEMGWTQSIAHLEKLVNGPVVMERTFNASAETVWKALTDRDEMKKWYFDLAEFRPEVGFEFQFMGGKEDRQYLHLCKITEVIPCRKLTHSWRYDGYDGSSFVTFELLPAESGTKLRLSHVGLDTFPVSNPDFAKHNFVEGWTYIVHTSLKNYLEKTSANA